ncbi:MAG: sulfite exporter TauE/SafE family protein [Nitrososphaerales archaeon]
MTLPLIDYVFLMLLISVFAGLVGALVGVGGGIIIVPVLTLFFNIPVGYAIGTSIVSVIATSSGSASAYVKDKITNLRVGTFLVTATTVGATAGAITTIYLIASGLSWAVYLSFGIVLLFSALDFSLRMWRRGYFKEEEVNTTPNSLAERLELKGEYYDIALKQSTSYIATRVREGYGIMLVAGVLSGLLGIGSGALKVIGMDRMMKLPFKVSTTTSNLMIGVTAAASAGIFYIKGFVNPILVAPVAVGVLLGAYAGSKILIRVRPSSLRVLFVIVLVVLGTEMLQKGLVF